MPKNEEGRWITTETGTHVFIKNGETVEQALSRQFEGFGKKETSKEPSAFDKYNALRQGKQPKENNFFKQMAENKKNQHIKDNNYFFGGEDNWKQVSNSRIEVKKHKIDNDNIVILTKNVRYWKNKNAFVLWVGNNKVVYLKDFNIKAVNNYEHLGNAMLVKLNRNYFKPYSTYENEEMMFDKDQDFDDLVKVAEEQDEHYQKSLEEEERYFDDLDKYQEEHGDDVGFNFENKYPRIWLKELSPKEYNEYGIFNNNF